MGPSRLRSARAAGGSIVAVLLLCGASLLRAQLGPLVSPFQSPQAKTQEELDIYLQIVTESDAAKVIREVAQLAGRYPESDLLGVAYQYQMFAYQRLNDFDGLLRAGHEALRLQPKNLNTMLTLALAIPEAAGPRHDSAELLNQAEQYARQSLEEIPGMRIPRRVSMEQWQELRAEMTSRAHEALGSILLRRGNLEAGVAELEAARRLNSDRTGIQYYKLGLAYAQSGKPGAAQEAWQQAAKLGPEGVRELALKKLGTPNSKR